MGDDAGLQTGQNRRRPFRIQVDVLATPEQADRLHEVIGEALCMGPHDHPGPCRIAWSIMTFDGADADEEGSGGLTPDDVAELHKELDPIQVWSEAEVNRSLGL
jgi:hypothetical protein